MSYYDPKYYNYDALSEQQKRLVDVYDMVIEDAGNKGFIVDDLMGLGDDADILTKIKREVAEETIDAVVSYLSSQRLEMIVSLLDSVGEE